MNECMKCHLPIPAGHEICDACSRLYCKYKNMIKCYKLSINGKAACCYVEKEKIEFPERISNGKKISDLKF